MRAGLTPFGYENQGKSKYKRILIDGCHVYEHRIIMEQQLGRWLKRSERVIHINGDTKDNRPENLRLAP